jgi:DNA-binding winged helix-turn-helix (wHTH) protein
MRVRFADFVFDSETRELSLRGESLRLSTKAFLLLETLIAEAPRALTKEDLYHRVWGDTYVEEANLPNLVSEVRSVLGENRRNARFIKTIHGFGYAFSGELENEAPRSRRRKAASERSVYLQWRREELPLQPGENVVGRADDADVAIDSAAVSRHHARIVVAKGRATIEDLGSKNGTFVCGKRVAAPAELRDGDEIRFGMVSVVFRSIDRGASTMSEMPC